MSDSTSGYQQLFAELKRRRVFRVMAVYGLVGFAVLQVVDLAVPALLLPEWTYRFVALLLLVGFPVAIVLAWAFEQTPGGGWRRTSPAQPGEIAAIVAQPAAHRWTSGLFALLGAVALLLGAGWVGRRTALRTEPGVEAASPGANVHLAFTDDLAPDRPSIAVLPFMDMSPGGDQEYFSDGMTEELLNALAKIPELKVMSRTSAFAYKGRSLDVRALGDSLGARYVVEGSVRKAGDQLRITAQLIDTDDGSHLWSEQYDRRLENVFEIQTEIAQAIAGALRVPLGLESEQLVSPTEDMPAYDLYLAGRAQVRRRHISEAIKLFEAAIARDSSWAPAWAGLAESRALVPFYTPGPVSTAVWADNLDAAEHAARRALALDPDNSSALVALGNVLRDRWKWDEAERAYLEALNREPENVEANQQYAEFLAAVGRLDEAYEVARRALELDRAPIRLQVAGYISGLNGRSEEAIAFVSEGIARDSSGTVTPLLRENLRWQQLRIGDWAAVREWQLGILDTLDAARAARVRRIWPKSAEMTPEIAEAAFPDWRAGFVLAELGQRQRALGYIETYVPSAPPFGNSAGLWDPVFDAMRGDPRFQALLAARGLEGRRPVRLPPGSMN